MALTVASFLITGALCSGILYIMTWHWRRRNFYKLASKFPGPPVLPIIGNAHLLAGNTGHVLNKLDELSRSYSSPFRLWLLQRLLIFVDDPELMKVICSSPKTLAKSQMFIKIIRPFLGTGIFTAPVPKWKVHRKLIQPTFNPRILDSFVQIFAAQSKILTDKMERNLDGPEFELFELFSSCTLDMICETAMGVKVGAQSNGNLPYVKAAQKIIAGLGERCLHFWLRPDFIFYRTQLGKDQQKHIKVAHGFTDEVIQTRRNDLLKISSQPDEAENEDETSESKPRREVFLDHLLKLSSSGVDLSEEALRAEVDTMVFGGNETSAVTDSNVMLMLASHPEIQEKAYQELYEIYGDSDIDERPVTSKDLPRMKYLERVIKETLRLFPVAPLIIRLVTDDLNIGEHTFPNESIVLIGILSLQRNEKYWPDPLKFNPDRFLPDEISKRHPYAYMAFSGGPRNCIGLNYAIMAMKTLVATVMRRYVLKKDAIVPVKDIRLKMEMIMKTVDPVTLRIEKRIKNSSSLGIRL